MLGIGNSLSYTQGFEYTCYISITIDLNRVFWIKLHSMPCLGDVCLALLEEWGKALSSG